MLSSDFIEIVAGTNLEEVSEFFRSYVSWWHILLFVCATIVIPFVYCKKLHNKFQITRRNCFLPVFLLIVSTVGVCRNHSMISYEVKGTRRWAFRYDEIVDLRDHPTNPILMEADSIHPLNIIVILGEPFSKNHSSLYGYSRETNPFLKKRKKKEIL